MGCYGPAKNLLGATKENHSVLRNVAAGSLSGALAAWASNPIDLLKTRLQSKDNPHKTSSAVVRHIIKEDGVRGLWRGTVPSTVGISSAAPPPPPRAWVLHCAVTTSSICLGYVVLSCSTSTYLPPRPVAPKIQGGGHLFQTGSRPAQILRDAASQSRSKLVPPPLPLLAGDARRRFSRQTS